MTHSHASSSRRAWRIAALVSLIESALLLMAWGMFLASGTPLVDFTPFSTATLPAYQRAALLVLLQQPHTGVVPIAVPLVTWGLFRRASGRPSRRSSTA